MKPIVLMLMLLALMSVPLAAQDNSAAEGSEGTEQNISAEEPGTEVDAETSYDDTEYGIGSPGISASGFLETSFSSSINKPERIRFYEAGGRIKVKPKYEINDITVYADIDYFANSGADSEVRDSETLETVEMYIRGGGNFQWCVGKQRFNWGTGDVFQPTNLMDRSDMRRSFARDNDDRYTGVYAVSLKYITGDFGLELGWRPVYETQPAPSGFYQISQENIRTPAGTVIPRYKEDEIRNGLNDSAAALRFGGTSRMFDWHALYYSGQPNQMIYKSILNPESGTVYADLEPVRRRSNVFGADTAFAFSKLNVRLEGAYSHDMSAVRSAGEDEFSEAMADVMTGSSAVLNDVTRRQYMSYSAGIDYNLWGDYGTVYFEWMQARYLDENGVEPLLQSDIAVIRAEDKFLNEALAFKLSSLVRTRDGSPGIALNGEAEYDFKNGLIASIGFWYFIANDDEYIEMLDSMKMAYFSMRYSF